MAMNRASAVSFFPAMASSFSRPLILSLRSGFGSYPAETERRRFQGDPTGVRALALSDDGKMLASAGKDQSIRLWETTGWKELRRLTGHQGAICSLAFAPDSKTLISGGTDRTIRSWDTTKGVELRSFSTIPDQVHGMVLSPDGKLAASRDTRGGTVSLWDVAQGKRIRQWQAPRSLARPKRPGLSFSPDGKILAGTINPGETLLFWDVATGKELRRLSGFTCSGQVAYAPMVRRLQAARPRTPARSASAIRPAARNSSTSAVIGTGSASWPFRPTVRRCKPAAPMAPSASGTWRPASPLLLFAAPTRFHGFRFQPPQTIVLSRDRNSRPSSREAEKFAFGDPLREKSFTYSRSRRFPGNPWPFRPEWRLLAATHEDGPFACGTPSRDGRSARCARESHRKARL